MGRCGRWDSFSLGPSFAQVDGVAQPAGMHSSSTHSEIRGRDPSPTMPCPTRGRRTRTTSCFAKHGRTASSIDRSGSDGASRLKCRQIPADTPPGTAPTGVPCPDMGGDRLRGGDRGRAAPRGGQEVGMKRRLLVAVIGITLWRAGAGLAASGDLDPSFGTGGVVTTSLGPTADAAYAVLVQPDGDIVVAGHTIAGTRHALI